MSDETMLKQFLSRNLRISDARNERGAVIGKQVTILFLGDDLDAYRSAFPLPSPPEPRS